MLDSATAGLGSYGTNVHQHVRAIWEVPGQCRLIHSPRGVWVCIPVRGWVTLLLQCGFHSPDIQLSPVVLFYPYVRENIEKRFSRSDLIS